MTTKTIKGKTAPGAPGGQHMQYPSTVTGRITRIGLNIGCAPFHDVPKGTGEGARMRAELQERMAKHPYLYAMDLSAVEDRISAFFASDAGAEDKSTPAYPPRMSCTSIGE
jgi:hypothetical protein